MRALLFCLLFPLSVSAQDATLSDQATKESERSFRMGVELVADLNAGSPAYFYKGTLSTPILRRAPVLNVSADWKAWKKAPYLRLQLLLARHPSDFDERISAFQLTGVAGGPDIHERISCEIVQVGVGLQLESPTPGKITPYLRLNFLMGFPQHLRYEMTHKNDSIALPALRQMMDGTRISPGWKLGVGLCYQLLPQLSLQFGVNYITQKVRVGWPIVAYRNFQGVAMRWQSVGISLGAQVHW